MSWKNILTNAKDKLGALPLRPYLVNALKKAVGGEDGITLDADALLDKLPEKAQKYIPRGMAKPYVEKAMKALVAKVGDESVIRYEESDKGVMYHVTQKINDITPEKMATQGMLEKGVGIVSGFFNKGDKA